MEQDKRFQVILNQMTGVQSTAGSGLAYGEATILLDTVTGMQYLFVSSGERAGLTPLLGPDGRPLSAPPPADSHS